MTKAVTLCEVMSVWTTQPNKDTLRKVTSSLTGTAAAVANTLLLWHVYVVQCLETATE